MRLLQKQIFFVCCVILIWHFGVHAQTQDSSTLAPSGKNDSHDLQEKSIDSDTGGVKSKLQNMGKIKGRRERSDKPEKERPEPQLKQFNRREEDQ